jgi:hypothetical protein
MIYFLNSNLLNETSSWPRTLAPKVKDELQNRFEKLEKNIGLKCSFMRALTRFIVKTGYFFDFNDEMMYNVQDGSHPEYDFGLTSLD